jgi:hypothetical protein
MATTEIQAVVSLKKSLERQAGGRLYDALKPFGKHILSFDEIITEVKLKNPETELTEGFLRTLFRDYLQYVDKSGEKGRKTLVGLGVLESDKDRSPITLEHIEQGKEYRIEKRFYGTAEDLKRLKGKTKTE